MATLKTATFPRDKSGKDLLGKVQSALTNLTGFRAPNDANYAVAPTKLDADRDLLKSNYKTIWQQCTIEYDPKQAGAEVAPVARKMKIGPFFLDPTTTVMDMEKVILHEYLHLSRTILMDGSQHPPDPDPFWMGHSIGRWEGDTLVVDSVGFKESEISGYKTTESLHVVEHFRRPNLGTLEYEAIIEDPNVFAGPWLIARTFPLLPEYNRVDEFFCENNRDYKPLFGK